LAFGIARLGRGVADREGFEVVLRQGFLQLSATGEERVGLGWGPSLAQGFGFPLPAIE
jgi:hypothetical protein